MLRQEELRGGSGAARGGGAYCRGTKLWHTLKSVYGFGNFLNIIRNTYLMGKGGLYQLLLDGISAQTYVPVQDTRRANLTLMAKCLAVPATCSSLMKK